MCSLGGLTHQDSRHCADSLSSVMKLPTHTGAYLPGGMLVEFQQACNPALQGLPGKTPGSIHQPFT